MKIIQKKCKNRPDLSPVLLSLSIAVLAFGLNACGQKGALYLPNEAATQKDQFLLKEGWLKRHTRQQTQTEANTDNTPSN